MPMQNHEEDPALPALGDDGAARPPVPAGQCRDRQAAANRRNARQSTGPRTPEGKAHAARNALTHGMSARAVLLPDESTEAYVAFRYGLFAALAPEGALEVLLAERVTAAAWRLQRALRIEADIVRRDLSPSARAAALMARAMATHEHANRQDAENATEAHQGRVRCGTGLGPPNASALSTGEAGPETALEDEPTGLGLAWLRKGRGLERLVRYEGAHERTLYRALHELQRVQAARAGQAPPPAGAVDVWVRT